MGVFFFFVRLAKGLAQVFAMSKKYTDREGHSHRVCLPGIPMGWTFTAGLLQAIQRYSIAQIGGDPTQEIKPFSSYEYKSIHNLYVATSMICF